MIIEIGKTYKERNGNIVTIEKTIFGNKFIGKYQDGKVSERYKANGKHWTCFSQFSMFANPNVNWPQHDLIEEVK